MRWQCRHRPKTDATGVTSGYVPTSTGGVHSSSPVIDEKRKRLYLVSEDNQIFGIGVREGLQQWRSNIGAPGIHPGVILSEKYLAQPNKLGDITYFDLDASKVHLRTQSLSYDYMVIALGVTTGYFGNHQWARFAPGLKTLDEATELRRRVLSAFERAELANDPDEASL